MAYLLAFLSKGRNYIFLIFVFGIGHTALNWMSFYQRTHYESRPANPDRGSRVLDLSNDDDGEKTTPVKRILLYTPFFTTKDWHFGIGGPQLFYLRGCPVTNCKISNMWTNSLMLKEYDAVLFHMRNVHSDPKEEQIEMPNPQDRDAKQIYAMMIMESPMRDWVDYNEFTDYFNMTMSYRKKSDIVRPYGWVVAKGIKDPYTSTKTKWLEYNRTEFMDSLKHRPKEFHSLANRKGQAVWMVSHCRTLSHRERYVKELRKHVNVTIFGNCGEEQCASRQPSVRTLCDNIIQEDYKFYLSFENAFCDEYVTEKFFLRLNQSFIPIVMGGGNYSDVAPPHSYIDVADYQEPKDLADYLNFLDDNPAEYLSYFWWKDHYHVITDRGKDGEPFYSMCKLCEILNQDTPYQKSYHNMTEWIRLKPDGSDTCGPHSNYPWSKY